jgi:putative ABC transport system permease protein
MQVQPAGEVMRVRGAIENLTYVLASLIVLLAALLSAAMVARRITRPPSPHAASPRAR